jgi:DNA-binding transcriptional LysR family regulator
MDLRLPHLRTFAAVAEHLHFGNAARALGIPQPTASRHVRELEEELGVALFVRTSRSTTLTDAGAAVLDHAHAVLDRAERLRSAAEIAGRQARGEVTVAFTSSTVNAFLTPLVQRVSAEHPEVELRVTQLRVRDLIAQLRSQAVDLAIAREIRFGGDDVVARRLSVEPMAVAVGVGHRLASGGPIALGDLRGEPVVMLDRRTSPRAYDAWMARLSEHGVEPTVVHHAPSYQSGVALVAAGAGVLALPASAAITRDDVTYAEIADTHSQIMLFRRATPPSPPLLIVVEAAMAVAAG